MNLIYAAYLLLPAMAMGASAVSVSTPVLSEGTPVYSASLTFLSRVSPAATGGPALTGTVTFTVDGLLGAPQPMDATGAATIRMVFNPGAHSVVAQYNGDANYLAGTSATLILTVDKAASWVAMSSTPAQLSQPVSLRAAPALMSPANAAAAGTVDFATGGAAIASCTGVPVVGGVATCSTTFAQIATVAIAAAYSGDANCKPSTGILQLTVGKVVAGTYIASAPAAPVYGSPVSLSALLLGAPGVPLPTGSIAFERSGAILAAVPVGADGRAALVVPSGSLAALPAGTIPIEAVYAGDDHYQPSRSLTLNLTVAKALATVALTATTTQVGQITTFKATVGVPGGVAGGTIAMSNADVAICTGIALQNGIATCPLKTEQATTYTIRAVYSGDANTLPASATLQFGVSRATPGVAVSSATANPAFGSPVALTAIVTGTAGQAAPTGTVAFTEGSTGLGVSGLGADGKASVGALLGVGTHSIVAVYSGDTNYQAVTAQAFNVVVAKAAANVLLTATPAQVGQATTLKATVLVNGSSGGAGGTVSMTNGTAPVCTAVPVVSGIATCSLTILQTGAFTINAAYSGDSNTLAGAASLQFAVGRRTPGVTTSYTPAAPVYAAPVTIAALVVGPAGQSTPGGTVSFTDGAATLGTATLGTDGRAATIATLSAGTHSVVASYVGDQNYEPAAALPVGIVVAKAATTVTLTATQAQVGQAAALRATVAVAGTGGVPGGTVTMTNSDATICAGVALQAGVATCSLSIPQNGTYSLRATCSGDGNTAPSTATLQYSVGKAAPAISTSYIPAAPVYGTPVTLTALVAGSPGQTAPGGTVTFTDGAATLGTAVPGADGRASVTASLAVGTHSIVAAYSGDGNYQPAMAPAFSVVVGKAATTISTSHAPAAPVYGAPVTLTALIAGSPGQAGFGGTVVFIDGATALGTAVPGADGRASVTAWLTVGTHSIVAAYSGDGNYQSATAPAFSIVVGKAATTLSLAATPPAPASGAPVTLTASIAMTPGQASPGGTVTFTDGATSLGTAAPGADGRASVTASLALGTHSLVAAYSGDGNYQSATAPAFSVVVGKAAATISLTATPPAPVSGAPVTLTASLAGTPGHPAPGGTVTFTDGALTLGTVAPGADGRASVTASLTVGTHSIVAAYSGDGNYQSATAPAFNVVVGKAAATLSLTVTPPAPAYGAPVTLTASLVGTPGQPSPGGTVTFTDGAATLGTAAPGADGRASVTASLTVGTHSIVAAYSGDGNYQSSTAPAFSVVVGKAAATLSLTATPAELGQTTTLTATVVTGGAGVSVGTVSMTTGDATICAGVPVQNGVATCSLKILQVGAYTIGASYTGDANIASSTGSLQFSVGKPAASVSSSFTPAAPVYGVPVTIVATVSGTPGQTAPGGTVTFAEGGSTLGTSPVGADGRATLIQTLTVGTHSIVAVYNGDGNHQGVSASALTVVVGKAATSVAITASPGQIAQPATLRAAVTLASPSAGTAGGAVDFTNGGAPIAGCTGVTLQNGIALCATSFPQLGDFTIAAGYRGDANTGASSAALALTVGKVLAGLYTAVSLTAPPFGAPVTVNALLLGATGVPAPTGTVAFSDGSTPLGSVAVGTDGRASLVLGSAAPLSLGTHSIGAAYSGDVNYQPTAAPALDVAVGKAAVNVVLTSNAAQVGQPLALKADVTVVAPGSATPGGTVDFTNGGAPIPGCTGTALQSGTAACNATLTQLGDSIIAAAYTGDAHTAAAAATLRLTVGKAVAGVYTASAPSAPVYGVAVSINALLIGAAGLPLPAGSVTFSEGPAALGAAPVGADGRASLVLPSGSLAPLAAGSHNIVAVYNGDANYGVATAAALNVTIAKSATNTVLSAGGGPVTATVTVVAPGAGSPTGVVQFLQAGASIGAVVLVQQGSSFVATLPSAPPGGNLWAVYQGDGNFAASTSAVAALASPVQVSMVSDRNPSTAGQPVTFTIRVGAAAGTPAGAVQLSVDGSSAASMTLVNGQAAWSTSSLPAGTHTIRADYAGDSSYAAGSATLDQVVAKSTFGLTLTSSAGTTVYGQPVTFQAQLGLTQPGTSPPSEGTVQFFDGTSALGSARIVDGAATLPVANLPVGPHSVTASWTGDAAGAVSSAWIQTVNQAQTVTVLSAAGGTLTAVVAPVAPGAGVPTGTVRFLNPVTNAVLDTVALKAGAAATAMSSDSPVAVYSGDAGFLGSTSAPLIPLTAVNAASYALASFAPDELVTIFGTNLASSTISATGGPAASLGGTTVAVTDFAGVKHPAQLLYVSPAQLSFLMPAGLPLGPATITVTNSKGVVDSTAIHVVSVAPGLFTLNSTGAGVPAAQLVQVHLDGTQDALQDVGVFDSARNEWLPAKIDLGAPTDVVYLLLYGTGIRHNSTMPLCTLNGLPATVAYAGAQGSFAGLDQVNVALPRTLIGAGTVELKLVVDGVPSNPVTLAFR